MATAKQVSRPAARGAVRSASRAQGRAQPGRIGHSGPGQPLVGAVGPMTPCSVPAKPPARPPGGVRRPRTSGCARGRLGGAPRRGHPRSRRAGGGWPRAAGASAVDHGMRSRSISAVSRSRRRRGGRRGRSRRRGPAAGAHVWWASTRSRWMRSARVRPSSRQPALTCCQAAPGRRHTDRCGRGPADPVGAVRAGASPATRSPRRAPSRSPHRGWAALARPVRAAAASSGSPACIDMPAT